jgi:hypothetical protein
MLETKPQTTLGQQPTSLVDNLPKIGGAPAIKNNNDLAQAVLNKGSVGLPSIGGPSAVKPLSSIQEHKISTGAYDIPVSTLYDRNRDGSYTAKYLKEGKLDYVGPEGNEDRLARQQSALDKIGLGTTRMGSKIGIYALDAVFGTANGIFEAINAGEWSKIWDNDLSNMFDDLDKSVSKNLAVYKTEDYYQKNILENMFTNPLTFITGDLFDGLAFVGGAMLPELGMAIISGGATAPSSLAKVGARLGVKSMQKSKAMSVARMYNNAKWGEKAGDLVRTTGFLARTSNFEASVEARHNYHEAVDNYLRYFEESNGRPPSTEELTRFMDDARGSANGVHLANLAILSVSNMAMFGKTFGVGNKMRQSVNDFGNNIIGLKPILDPKTRKLVLNPTKSQKVIGNAYKILSKPAIEGLYEEGFQGVAGETMQNYLESMYDPKYDGSMGLMANIADAFAHTYGTKEGWNEIGLGMIIGSLGGTLTSMATSKPMTGKFSVEPLPGFGSDSYSSKLNDLQKTVTEQNQRFEDLSKVITKQMNSANSALAFSQRAQDGVTSSAMETITGGMVGLKFLESQMHLKSVDEVVDDYRTIVESTELDPSIRETLGLQDKADESAYKESMIENFALIAEDYKSAKKFVDRLGLDGVEVAVSEGNKALISDIAISGMVMGQLAKRAGTDIAQTISSLVGDSGIADAALFYANLDKKGKEVARELDKTRRDIDKARAKLTEYTKKLEGMVASPGLSNKSLETRRNRLAEKRMVMAQRVSELEQQQERITKNLEYKSKVDSVEIDSDAVVSPSRQTIIDNLEKLQQLDEFSRIMREEGDPATADTLDFLVSEFKSMMDMSNEMNDFIRAMGDTNFFTSDKYQGLLGSLIGTRYAMTEEFRKELRDNQELIDRQMNLVGYRGYNTVEELVENVLEKNTKISDREKFRMESLIRMFLNTRGLAQMAEDSLQNEQAVQEVEKISTVDPLTGDTISLTRVIDIESKGLNNIDILDQLINEMVSAIDRSNGLKRGTEASKILSRLDELSKERDAIEKAADKTDEQVAKLEEIQKEEETLKGKLEKISTVKIIDQQDISRVEDLLAKRETEEGLNEEEIEELVDLESYFDQWMDFTGAVAQGLRLSDLIRLKAQLQNTEITELPNLVAIPSATKALRGDMGEKGSGANYNLTQTYDTVMASTVKNGNISITGMSYEELVEMAGMEFDTVEDAYENSLGNVVITPATRSMLNEQSNLKINPRSARVKTNFSVVLHKGADGKLKPLPSPFKKDFHGRKRMNPNSLYEVNPQDKVTLTINPRDPYNQQLLDDYRNAKNDKERKAAKEALKRGLVIRQVIGGEFSGVLKSKRNVEIKQKGDSRFEAMRDELIDNDEFFNKLLNDNAVQSLPFSGDVTVKKVYLGHPNLNYVEAENGEVEIESLPISEADASKIVDIGYLEKGQLKTRSKEKGIDTSFIQDEVEKSQGNEKYPVVVIEKGGRKIAYPVEVRKLEAESLDRFNTTWKSDSMSNEEKVYALNNMLAQRGLDIKDIGNAFTFQNIENGEFFENIVAKLESIDYFYNVEDWVKKDSDMKAILTEQVLIDLNLSNPFHSPKAMLNFDGLDIPNSHKPSVSSPKPKISKAVKEKAKEEKDKDC